MENLKRVSALSSTKCINSAKIREEHCKMRAKLQNLLHFTKMLALIDLKFYFAGQNRRGSANKSLKLITQINPSPCGRDCLVLISKGTLTKIEDKFLVSCFKVT